ncbi:MAG: VOC family protein [Bryobacteraceae bacterium]|nr:VOC family protein [Bryobacteraceae bacterium]
MPTTKVALSPYLCVGNAAEAIGFYERAFGARQTMRIDMPDGRVGHAEIAIGEVTVMLSDEFPEMGVVSPRTLGGTSVSLYLEVPDADAMTAQAEEAGATVLRPVELQFYGHRRGDLRDPYGRRWFLSTEVEQVRNEEIERRAREGR